jgi:hypothetical protein
MGVRIKWLVRLQPDQIDFEVWLYRKPCIFYAEGAFSRSKTAFTAEKTVEAQKSSVPILLPLSHPQEIPLEFVHLDAFFPITYGNPGYQPNPLASRYQQHLQGFRTTPGSVPALSIYSPLVRQNPRNRENPLFCCERFI